MTRDELTLRIQTFFENNVYYTTADINNAIQDGLDEVAAVTGCIVKGVVLPFVANLSYYDFRSLIPDYIGTIAIFNRTTKLWMFPNSTDAWDQDRNDWETCVGTPEEFAVISWRYTAIYKKPGVVDYGDMYVFYVASAPTLSGNDTIPIDDTFTNTLEHYTQADQQEQMQEWIKAGKITPEYRDALNTLKAWAKSMRDTGRAPILK